MQAPVYSNLTLQYAIGIPPSINMVIGKTALLNNHSVTSSQIVDGVFEVDIFEKCVFDGKVFRYGDWYCTFRIVLVKGIVLFNMNTKYKSWNYQFGSSARNNRYFFRIFNNIHNKRTTLTLEYNRNYVQPLDHPLGRQRVERTERTTSRWAPYDEKHRESGQHSEPMADRHKSQNKPVSSSQPTTAQNASQDTSVRYFQQQVPTVEQVTAQPAPVQETFIPLGPSDDLTTKAMNLLTSISEQPTPQQIQLNTLQQMHHACQRIAFHANDLSSAIIWLMAQTK